MISSKTLSTTLSTGRALSPVCRGPVGVGDRFFVGERDRLRETDLERLSEDDCERLLDLDRLFVDDEW